MNTAESMVTTLVETAICTASLFNGVNAVQHVATVDSLSAFTGPADHLEYTEKPDLLTCNLHLHRNDYGEHGDNSYYGQVGLHHFPAGLQKDRE